MRFLLGRLDNKCKAIVVEKQTAVVFRLILSKEHLIDLLCIPDSKKYVGRSTYNYRRD